MNKPKPVKVKNIWSKVIFYGNARRRPGAIFWIENEHHFSKSGYMVMLDENDKEIRHLGGYRNILAKDEKGNELIVRTESLKGQPVRPGEVISQPTAEEREDIEREDEYQEQLKKLQADFRTAKAPEAYVPPLGKLPSPVVVVPKGGTEGPILTEETGIAASNQNVI